MNRDKLKSYHNDKLRATNPIRPLPGALVTRAAGALAAVAYIPSTGRDARRSVFSSSALRQCYDYGFLCALNGNFPSSSRSCWLPPRLLRSSSYAGALPPKPLAFCPAQTAFSM